MAECSSSKRVEVNRAYIERHFYGTQELHVSDGFEANLDHYNISCKKNPGHKQFIPAIYFNIDNMPDDYRDKDIVDLIKATAHLTVRISIQYVSLNRPEFWPKTELPYPFHKTRGTNKNVVGTGIVWRVNVYGERDGKGACTCQRCKLAVQPSQIWGVIGVFTAKHVVFDSVEANNTSCRLFFDTQDSETVILDGWNLDEADLEEDWCRLHFITCNLNLLKRLDKLRSDWNGPHKNVYNKYRNSRNIDRINFIVSHPHGCPKQVSVGHWVQRLVVKEEKDKQNAKYTYTTCTCAGSSGALVHSMGYGGWYTDQVHSGVNAEGVNFSCTGYDKI